MFPEFKIYFFWRHYSKMFFHFSYLCHAQIITGWFLIPRDKFGKIMHMIPLLCLSVNSKCHWIYFSTFPSAQHTVWLQKQANFRWKLLSWSNSTVKRYCDFHLFSVCHSLSSLKDGLHHWSGLPNSPFFLMKNACYVYILHSFCNRIRLFDWLICILRYINLLQVNWTEKILDLKNFGGDNNDLLNKTY